MGGLLISATAAGQYFQYGGFQALLDFEMRRVPSMRPRVLFLLLATCSLPAISASADPLWRKFAPAEKVEAEPGASYVVGEQHGPWLVMAATFSGEEAEEQARELVLELRKHYNLRAYMHAVTFNFAEEDQRVGRGIDSYGAPTRMRYQNGEQNREVAVLVGDFPTIDDPEAQKLLERIKKMRPQSLSGDLRNTAQNLAQEREYLARLHGTKGAPPMHKAFLTRNPVLPAEYFRPQGVDPFVAKMNAGVEHSLLDCPGKYTVKIATFRGKAELQGAMTSRTKLKKKKKQNDVDPLVEAAESAHDLTTFLRAKGWEAFEFHDRTESYVTVGSYDVATEPGPQGPQLIRDLQIIIRTFGAAYETPSALNVNQQLPPEDSIRAEQVRQKFDNLFVGDHGEVAHGLKPKYIEAQKGKFITLDVHPYVMEAPRRSVTSVYAQQR
jgi:hypothetical protein